jgi:hypothetical protein
METSRNADVQWGVKYNQDISWYGPGNIRPVANEETARFLVSNNPKRREAVRRIVVTEVTTYDWEIQS